MRLLFACPTYGPSPDPVLDKSRRAAIMFAANHGVTWVGDVSPDRMGWAAARNKVVESVLEADKELGVDGVFWVDDDMLIPIETIAKLVSYGHDFVSGLYFQRASPYWPLFAFLNKQNTFEWPAEYPQNVIAKCDGVGFGCVYTSTNLLRGVSELSECREVGPFGGDFGKKSYGEDFTFCLRAKRAGFQAYVDTAVKCEHHMGPEYSNELLFKRMGGLKGGSNGGKTSVADQKDGGHLHQEDCLGSGQLHPGAVQYRLS